MTTRQSVDECMQQCEDAIRFAQEQFSEAEKQEHYNETEFHKALQHLEDTTNYVNQMTLSSNSQQREQLYRKRIQLQKLQNDMILLEH